MSLSIVWISGRMSFSSGLALSESWVYFQTASSQESEAPRIRERSEAKSKKRSDSRKPRIKLVEKSCVHLLTSLSDEPWALSTVRCHMTGSDSVRPPQFTMLTTRTTWRRRSTEATLLPTKVVSRDRCTLNLNSDLASTSLRFPPRILEGLEFIRFQHKMNCFWEDTSHRSGGVSWGQQHESLSAIQEAGKGLRPINVV